MRSSLFGFIELILLIGLILFYRTFCLFYHPTEKSEFGSKKFCTPYCKQSINSCRVIFSGSCSLYNHIFRELFYLEICRLICSAILLSLESFFFERYRETFSRSKVDNAIRILYKRLKRRLSTHCFHSQQSCRIL